MVLLVKVEEDDDVLVDDDQDVLLDDEEYPDDGDPYPGEGVGDPYPDDGAP